MQGSELLQLGHQRQRRVLHLLLIPLLIAIMYWYDWNTTTVITCSIFLAMTVYYSFAHTLNRHVTIDPARKEVEIEWVQWGLFSIDKRRCSFDEFSAVRYHTYHYGSHDNLPEAQFGLYLVHSVADLWPCGDTGLDSYEPRYDRDMAVKVAQVMGLPLQESDDEPWADKPKFKKMVVFSELEAAGQR